VLNNARRIDHTRKPIASTTQRRSDAFHGVRIAQTEVTTEPSVVNRPIETTTQFVRRPNKERSMDRRDPHSNRRSVARIVVIVFII
jgi:hypothetical protein